jgi:hypothetical protein
VLVRGPRSEPGGLYGIAWSRDSHVLYYNVAGTEPSYRKVRLGQTRSELLVDLRNLRLQFAVTVGTSRRLISSTQAAKGSSGAGGLMLASGFGIGIA